MARLPLLQKDEDYRAFERVLVQAMAKHPTRILAYCLMPNHWHFVLWPKQDERNPLRAGLVERAEEWPWSSLAHRCASDVDPHRSLLHPWPLPIPGDWAKRVSRVQTEAELEAVRRSVARGQPFGSETWQKQTARALDLEYTFHKQGRPRKPAQRIHQLSKRAARPLFLTHSTKRRQPVLMPCD